MFNAVAFFSTGLAFWSFLQIALHTLRGAAKRTLLSSSWIIVVIFVMSFVFRFLFTALSQSLFKVTDGMIAPCCCCRLIREALLD